jgi:hypothetical protein
MERLRPTASALMLISGITHTVHFLFGGASVRNSPLTAAFGLCFFVIGILLLRPRPIGLWFGAVVPGVGGALGTLLSFVAPGPLLIIHTLVAWVASIICGYLLYRSDTKNVALIVTLLIALGSGLVIQLFWRP